MDSDKQTKTPLLTPEEQQKQWDELLEWWMAQPEPEQRRLQREAQEEANYQAIVPIVRKYVKETSQRDGIFRQIMPPVPVVRGDKLCRPKNSEDSSTPPSSTP